MPYKSEKIKLQPNQDRRRRLTMEQRKEIIDLYETGLYSWNSLAKKYEVSKGTIGSIVSPVRQESLKTYRKEHWKDLQHSKEERTKAIREHRQYKQSLYLQGKLTEENK